MGKIINTPRDMWDTYQLMRELKNSPVHKAIEYQKKLNNPYKHAIVGYVPPRPQVNFATKAAIKFKNFCENVKFKWQLLK